MWTPHAGQRRSVCGGHGSSTASSGFETLPVTLTSRSACRTEGGGAGADDEAAAFCFLDERGAGRRDDMRHGEMLVGNFPLDTEESGAAHSPASSGVIGVPCETLTRASIGSPIARRISLASSGVPAYLAAT